MNKVFVFVLGAATGSLVTWGFVKKVYERIADEEIESVVEHYRNKEEIEELVEECEDKENVIELELEALPVSEKYEEKLEELGYHGESIDLGEEDEDCIVAVTEEAIEFVKPYTIAPEEYGEENYDTKSWTYYADGVLTDEIGNIIFEPEDFIGDGLEHFGEYEDDSVYIRNDNLEWDIEILKHEKTFTEINREDSI